MRKITVDGVNYDWRVGKSHVLIENRDQKLKFTPKIDEVIDDFGIVRPIAIERYIKGNV